MKDRTSLSGLAPIGDTPVQFLLLLTTDSAFV